LNFEPSAPEAGIISLDKMDNAAYAVHNPILKYSKSAICDGIPSFSPIISLKTQPSSQNPRKTSPLQPSIQVTYSSLHVFVSFPENNFYFFHIP